MTKEKLLQDFAQELITIINASHRDMNVQYELLMRRLKDLDEESEPEEAAAKVTKPKTTK